MESCKQELLRVAELQSDDYHKDRTLYYACRDDREVLCPHIKAGEGRVYRCLYRKKFEREMSDEVSFILILKLDVCRSVFTARPHCSQCRALY